MNHKNHALRRRHSKAGKRLVWISSKGPIEPSDQVACLVLPVSWAGTEKRGSVRPWERWSLSSRRESCSHIACPRGKSCGVLWYAKRPGLANVAWPASARFQQQIVDHQRERESVCVCVCVVGSVVCPVQRAMVCCYRVAYHSTLLFHSTYSTDRASHSECELPAWGELHL